MALDTRAVDIWCVGVLLYTLLCGFLPFEGSTVSSTRETILSGSYNIPEFVSEGARSILQKLFVVDPTKRMTMEELRDHPWFRLGIEGSGIPILISRKLDEIRVIRSQRARDGFIYNGDFMEEAIAEEDATAASESVAATTISATRKTCSVLNAFDFIGCAGLFSLAPVLFRDHEEKGLSVFRSSSFTTNAKPADIVRALIPILHLMKCQTVVDDAQYKVDVSLETGSGLLEFCVLVHEIYNGAHMNVDIGLSLKYAVEFRRVKGSFSEFQRVYRIVRNRLPPGTVSGDERESMVEQRKAEDAGYSFDV